MNPVKFTAHLNQADEMPADLHFELMESLINFFKLACFTFF